MKKQNIIKNLLALAVMGTLVSCNDFLDKGPLSEISPDKYLTDETQLSSFANGLYPKIISTHGYGYGRFGVDKHTDNQAADTYSNLFVPGEWKTAQVGGDWDFTNIYQCNYFLNTVLPRWEEESISGLKANVEHYIGEVYFLRALEYFNRYRTFGDFPIVTETLPDNAEVLVAASKRAPRTEVARFILADLDKAIELMSGVSVTKRTQISKEAAILLKSRVALYEGTWLKYFKGTAFVPTGEGWPGSEKEYNKNYQFQSGSIDEEIKFFLKTSMEAATLVAKTFTLVDNTAQVQQDPSEAPNPYMDMFGSVDLSAYDEVLLWREYNKALGVTHNVVVAAQFGNYAIGLTRGMVNSFLMSDGLPIYAPSSSYKGDDNMANIRAGRDSRLAIFLKEPGQKNILFPSPDGTHAVPVEPVPDILSGNAEKGYSTGFALRKGGSFDARQCGNTYGYTACVVFRGVEAYLNYMEACFELNGHLDDQAKEYWMAIRRRSKVDTDFQKTIDATDMGEEARGDWGAYSAGKLIDPVLYNIRRERRTEFMAEGYRNMDLCRWRAMDQMITTPYHIEGFKIWGEMKDWYKDENGKSKLVYGLENSAANVSDPARSLYLRPYEKNKTLAYDGYRFTMAHYLSPIAIQHLLITSDGDVNNSPLYQNPGWPLKANLGPME